MYEMKGTIRLYVILSLIVVLLTACGSLSIERADQKDSAHVQAEGIKKNVQDIDAEGKSGSEGEKEILSAENLKTIDVRDSRKEKSSDQEARNLSIEKNIVSPELPEGSQSDTLSHKGYKLEQVVVLSRHNIRAPLNSSGSVLETITPFEWASWTSNPGELSLRGGVLETIMGQYFRRWMESENLFPENYKPGDDLVRIYANSKQRTITTAQFFSSGFLPAAGLKVETHAEYDAMDPVFDTKMTFISDAYVQDIERQAKELFSRDIVGLADNYELLIDVIDMKKSKAWQDGSVEAFRTDDTDLILKENAQPNLSGSLKMAGRISDALVMQYYEEPDDEKAAFGKILTKKQWTMVSEVKDTYQDILFSTPLIAENVAHPLLREIQSEMSRTDRKFTFLCGHDSNVGSVLGALGAEEYELPGSIEKRVPIGCKLAFSRWSDKEGRDWICLDMIYQTADQMRNMSLLDLDAPPAIVSISIKGLKRNPDGLYTAEDVISRIGQAIADYDKIIKKYE